MISDNPSVQEFRNVITKQNEALVYKKRMLVLERGARFPKLPQKVPTANQHCWTILMFIFLFATERKE